MIAIVKSIEAAEACFEDDVLENVVCVAATLTLTKEHSLKLLKEEKGSNGFDSVVAQFISAGNYIINNEFRSFIQCQDNMKDRLQVKLTHDNVREINDATITYICEAVL